MFREKQQQAAQRKELSEALFRKLVARYTIVAGNPARTISELDEATGLADRRSRED